MGNIRQPHLDREIGCKVILDRIKKTTDPYEKKVLLWDFLTKFKKSNLNKIEPVVFDAINAFMPPEYQKIISPLKISEDEASKVIKVTHKKKIDIIFLTVILQELTAAKIALNISLDKEADRQVAGLRCWEKEIISAKSKIPLRVVLSMVGVPRTTPCALACETLFTEYEVEEACVLVGIAAGVEEKVKIGDVVCAESVIDYEGARVEESGKKKRPKPFTLKHNIIQDLVNFEPSKRDWHEQFQNAFHKLLHIEEVPQLPEEWKPGYHFGVILSGEKLIADGSLQVKREEYTDEMKALEMEASGFAAACHKHDIPWSIFRGVSDYGDKRKKGTKIWQTTAALAAATAAVNFLSNFYTRVKVPEF